MSTIRALARLVLHITVASALDIFAFHLFSFETLIAARNAVSEFLDLVTVELPHVPMNMFIDVATVIAMKAFGACYELVYYLSSNGAAFIYSIQTFPWRDLINGTEIHVQSLMEWFTALKELISKASGSTLGQLILLLTALFLFNILVALVETIHIAWRMVAFILRIVWNIVIFGSRPVWITAVFIYRLF